MNVCYALEPTRMKTRWQVLLSTNVKSERVCRFTEERFCYIGCRCLPRRKIGSHCVDVGSGWSSF